MSEGAISFAVKQEIIRNVLVARRKAEAAVVSALTQQLKPGDPVEWRRGGRDQHGTVLHLAGLNDRVKVRNSHTGAELWVTAYDIAEAGR